MNKEDRETITEREEFIKICGMLAYSDIPADDCKYIVRFIVGLEKEIEELHNKIEKANATIDTNLELIEHLGNKIDKAIEYIKNKQVIDLDYLEEILKG